VAQHNPDQEIAMKKVLCLTVCALSLLAFASTAQSDGGDASGTFTFGLGTAAGTVNFAGHLAHKDDPASGQISFNAAIDVSDEVCWNVANVEDPPRYVCEPLGDYTGEGLPRNNNVALNFLIDRMVVVDNRAAMSGTISGDSPFAGLHTILAVENASGNDGFTWGVYKTKIFRNDGDPEPHLVSLTGLDYDFCPAYTPPDNCGEFDCPPPPACNFDGRVIDDHNVLGPMLTYAASDYELCSYPPPTIDGNFLGPVSEGNQGGDPHNYQCSPGAPDPHVRPAGIPVEATQIITTAESFPLFTYPMTLIPHGGGNKVSVKPNG
jgi:hypothetical protein